MIACNGIGKDEFWQNNINGISGIKHLDTFDTSLCHSKIAGIIDNKFNPKDFMLGKVVMRTDRFVHLTLASTQLALSDSKLNLELENRDRIGTIMGSGLGGISFHEEELMRVYEHGIYMLNKANPSSVQRITPNAVGSHIAINFKIYGINMVISNACVSGTNAIGEAFRKIQYDEADIIITGGAEAPLTPLTFSAYDSMRILSTRNDNPEKASRPFDKSRDGFVLAEGCGVLIVEELEHALKRGAGIYAEITGYAGNSGAFHMVIPNPDALDVVKVMNACIKDADISLNQIDYINAHGTSTVQNDKVESQAIRILFENLTPPPISSTKSMTGHSIGASGAIEAIVSCLSIKNNTIPPTINYEETDCDSTLDYVPNKSRKDCKINNILSNSFGFGSNNASLIFSKYIDK